MDLIVNWVVNKMSKDTCSILDLGCGNGLLLIQLVFFFSFYQFF